MSGTDHRTPGRDGESGRTRLSRERHTAGRATFAGVHCESDPFEDVAIAPPQVQILGLQTTLGHGLATGVDQWRASLANSVA